MEGLEVLPHGVRRIGRAAGGERIGAQQITEFVYIEGHGRRTPGQHRGADSQRQKQHHGAGQHLTASQRFIGVKQPGERTMLGVGGRERRPGEDRATHRKDLFIASVGSPEFGWGAE